MKIIELVPALELGNKLNVDVMDFPGAPETDLPAGAGVFPEAAAEAGADDEGGADGEAGSFGILSDTRRKRCGITLEYAPRDIRQLREQGLDRPGMLDYYRRRIYELVRVNISQDWACCGGMEEVLAIVAKHID
ncbi:MAG: hypothetical protein IJ109_02725 [Firmicutes bacterium]|nr:hypothetical protein [Bacillota bacterium]